MIRRIFQNIRKQDWTAVVIELVVVILGVFIGVQVSNWNADLETERKAALFTSRLKADLREEAWGYEVQVGYYGQVLRNAIAAEDALAGRAPLSDEALLVAAYRATQYNAYIRRRATYDAETPGAMDSRTIAIFSDRLKRRCARGWSRSVTFHPRDRT